MSQDTPLPCDVVILTALPVVFQVVLAHLQNRQEVPFQTSTYHTGRFPGKQRMWRVAVVEIGLGGASVASETQRAVDFFHPRLMFLIGLASGFKDVCLGDVVVATKIYSYEFGKAGVYFKPYPDLWHPSHALLQRAMSEGNDDTWLDRIDGGRPDPVPQVHRGPLATGERIVTEQSDEYRLLQTTYSDTLAVEKGHLSYGFLAALDTNRTVDGLVIHGISNLIGDKSETDAKQPQEVAARHAAAFTFRVLARYALPLLPEGENLEYKEVVPHPRSLARLIASFANAKGGTIIIGVRERPEEVPTVVGLPDDLAASAFVQAALSYLEPRPSIDHYEDQIDGKNIYVLNIQKSPAGILTESGYLYVRNQTRVVLVEKAIREDKVEYEAKNLEVIQLLEKLKLSQSGASESKLEIVKHYSAIFRLVDSYASILSPISSSEFTRIQEGKVLSRLMLSSIVDTFEKYLRDLMFEIYLAEPRTLMSDAQVSVKAVLESGSIEGFVLFEASRRVENLSRGNIGEFIKTFEKSYKLELFSKSEIPVAEELFEVRHLYTHKNGQVDAKFLSKCPTQVFSVGQEHQMSVDELCKAANFLIDVLDRLDQEAVQKYHLETPTEEF